LTVSDFNILEMTATNILGIARKQHGLTVFGIVSFNYTVSDDGIRGHQSSDRVLWPGDVELILAEESVKYDIIRPE
jgi:hypothetical protein